MPTTVGADSLGVARFGRARMPETIRRGGDGDAPAAARLLAGGIPRPQPGDPNRVEPAGRALGSSPRSTNLFSLFSFGFFRGTSCVFSSFSSLKAGGARSRRGRRRVSGPVVEIPREQRPVPTRRRARAAPEPQWIPDPNLRASIRRPQAEVTLVPGPAVVMPSPTAGTRGRAGVHVRALAGSVTSTTWGPHPRWPSLYLSVGRCSGRSMTSQALGTHRPNGTA